MSSLFEIDRAIFEVIERGFSLDEETGEILFEIDDIEELQAQRADKLEACALYVKSLEAEAKAIKDEEAALKARRETKERKAERIRYYVAESLQRAGESGLETPRAVLSFRKSESVVIDDMADIPAAYFVEKVTSTPDKTAIKKAIKAGEIIEGAHIEERQNLQIK